MNSAPRKKDFQSLTTGIRPEKLGSSTSRKIGGRGGGVCWEGKKVAQRAIERKD